MSDPIRVMVTGATGFIGSEVARVLAQSKLDIVLTSLHGKETSVSACDLLDVSAIQETINRIKPTTIYHIAGSITNDYKTALEANVLATYNLIEAVRLSGNKSRILLVGSAAEYGKVSESENPIPETHPLMPVSIYGLSKKEQTSLMEYYTRVHSMDLVMARPFNVLGPGASSLLFVGSINAQIEQYVTGEISQIITGNLDAELDYIDVTSVASAFELIAEHGEAGEVYNVASGVKVRMRDLLAQMLDAAGIPWSTVVEKSGENRGISSNRCVYADITKLKHLQEITSK